MHTAETALAWLCASTDSALAIVRGASDAEIARRTDASQWSLGETLEHVALTNTLIARQLATRLGGSPLAGERFPESRISGSMFGGVAPPAVEVAAPRGRYVTAAAACAGLRSSVASLEAFVRSADFDLRGHGLPHPAFGLFDGVQWILFAAAHTDNHLGDLRKLRESSAPV